MKPGDEHLQAYVDGELGPEDAARVEAAMAADPAVADAVAQARRLRDQLRQAFAPMLDEPVPAHLLALARGGGATAPAAPASVATATVHALPRAPRRRWGLPEGAAMAAALVLGIAVSRFVLAPPAGPLASDAGRLVADGSLEEALQSQLASETDRGVGIGLSFRDREGRYCRGFRLGGERDLSGLACRSGGGRWEIPVVVSVPAAPAGELQQASTALPEAVLAEVDARIDGEPLDAGQEREARDAGWR